MRRIVLLQICFNNGSFTPSHELPPSLTAAQEYDAMIDRLIEQFNDKVEHYQRDIAQNDVRALINDRHNIVLDYLEIEDVARKRTDKGISDDELIALREKLTTVFNRKNEIRDSIDQVMKQNSEVETASTLPSSVYSDPEVSRWTEFEKLDSTLFTNLSPNAHARVSMLEQSLTALAKDPMNEQLLEDTIVSSNKAYKHMSRYQNAYSEYQEKLKDTSVAEYVIDTHRQSGVDTNRENFDEINNRYKACQTQLESIMAQRKVMQVATAQQVVPSEHQSTPVAKQGFVQRLIAFWTGIFKPEIAIQTAKQALDQSPIVKHPIKVIDAPNTREMTASAERERQSAIAGAEVKDQLRTRATQIKSVEETDKQSAPRTPTRGL